MFDCLVTILESDSIFRSTGNKPQHPVKFQLGCFLLRYGKCGSDTLDVAQKLLLGFGTVTLYCRQVTQALRRLRNHYIVWPHVQRKTTIKDCIHQRSGFPNCLGAGDGSLFHLTQSPFFYSNLYHCCKKNLAVSFVQESFRWTSACCLGQCSGHCGSPMPVHFI
jgi:hypothetical protein